MNPIVPQPSTVLVNGHALGKAFFYDNIGPGSDRVRKQYWAKFCATRDSVNSAI